MSVVSEAERKRLEAALPEIEYYTVEGPCRKSARAIFSLANHGGRVSTTQVLHLLQMGYAAGREADLRDTWDAVRQALDLAQERQKAREATNPRPERYAALRRAFEGLRGAFLPPRSADKALTQSRWSQNRRTEDR